MAEKKGHYRFSGQVTDQDGHPVVGATVVFGITSLSKRPSDDWPDNHHFEDITTGSDGAYTFDCPYPWVRFISARKEVSRPEIS